MTQMFHTHTYDDKNSYYDEMQNTKFVLCPRGTSPNSYRLYEAMSLGKCPVIISDDWVESEGPDWSSCSIRIAERDIKNINEILLEREQEAELLGLNAKQEWDNHFAGKVKFKKYLDFIVDMHAHRPRVTMSLEEYGKHWKSPGFYHNNEWAIYQRIGRLFGRAFSKFAG